MKPGDFRARVDFVPFEGARVILIHKESAQEFPYSYSPREVDLVLWATEYDHARAGSILTDYSLKQLLNTQGGRRPGG